MAKRVCAEPLCPTLVDAGTTRCPTHARAKDKARGTRQERGYDAAHDKLRARWARKVATGSVICWRCGVRIGVLDEWHLGHCDDDRSIYHGPEHAAGNLAHTRGGCTHISHVT